MKKILVVQQKMIGDVLLSTILVEHLKKINPNTKVDYLVNTHTKAVVLGNPFVDDVVEFLPEYDTSKIAFLKFLKSIRKRKYDMVVDAYAIFSSGLISFFSGADQKISYKKGYTDFFYSKTIERKSVVLTNAGNALENRLRLIFSEDMIEEKIVRPKIYLQESEINNAKLYLQKNGINFTKPLIMVSVLGSNINKTLPFSYMATLLNKIVEVNREVQILFNYIPNQLEQVNEVYNLTNAKTQEQIFLNIYGKSLREFLAILNHCDFLFGNEGGGVNMAKALNIPTFTVFSPWVKKEVWNMFDDDVDFVSVHLNDFKPHFYKNVELYKELKNQSDLLYKELIPELIIPVLENYLKKHF